MNNVPLHPQKIHDEDTSPKIVVLKNDAGAVTIKKETEEEEEGETEEDEEIGSPPKKSTLRTWTDLTIIIILSLIQFAIFSSTISGFILIKELLRDSLFGGVACTIIYNNWTYITTLIITYVVAIAFIVYGTSDYSFQGPVAQVIFISLNILLVLVYSVYGSIISCNTENNWEYMVIYLIMTLIAMAVCIIVSIVIKFFTKSPSSSFYIFLERGRFATQIILCALFILGLYGVLTENWSSDVFYMYLMNCGYFVGTIALLLFQVVLCANEKESFFGYGIEGEKKNLNVRIKNLLWSSGILFILYVNVFFSIMVLVMAFNIQPLIRWGWGLFKNWFPGVNLGGKQGEGNSKRPVNKDYFVELKDVENEENVINL